jgi:hypothetical protein
MASTSAAQRAIASFCLRLVPDSGWCATKGSSRQPGQLWSWASSAAAFSPSQAAPSHVQCRHAPR